MKSLKQEQVRSTIGNFFMENWTKGKVHTVKHFKAMGIAQNTIYRVFRRFEEGVGAEESLDLEDRLLNCLLNMPIR